jgi:hypothetical protein
MDQKKFKIGLRCEYHQIRTNFFDITKFEFRSRLDHYKYVEMPFGLTNVPATFMTLMHSFLWLFG